MNVGIGYDSHRLVAGRPLILGGITIPSEVGCVGHSDADAVAHALTDAILGAANAGNIGTMFPDTDARWKDADSIALLRGAYAAVRERGFRFCQADITIILEQPRLGPWIDQMATELARALDGGPDQISIKPKSNEGMGWIGRGEGVAVMAVATLDKS